MVHTFITIMIFFLTNPLNMSVLKFGIKNVKLEHVHTEELVFQVSRERDDHYIMAQRCLNVPEEIKVHKV